MEEAGFSINFHAYNGEGLQTQVTIRGANADEFFGNTQAFFARYPQMGGLDILLQNPPEGSLKPKKFHIIGWLRGETNSRDGELKPAVFLYSDASYLTFSVCTVYFEDLGKLPINWQSARNVGNGAPPVDRAKGQWNECNFWIQLQPQFDYEGNPLKTDKGSVKFRFAGVINEDGSPRETVATALNMPSQAVQAPPANGRVAAAPVPQQVQQRAPAPPQQRYEQHQFTPPSYDKTLDAIATRFDAVKGELDQNVVNFVQRMRSFDANRASTLTTDGTNEDGSHKTGQYQFLAGVIDNLTNDAAQIDGRHQEILSFIFGRPIHQDDRPGSGARVLFDEIYSGTNTKPNPKVSRESQDTLISIAYVVMNEIEQLNNASASMNAGYQSDIPF